VGTPSQSPAYVAGIDDIGQCVSVSAGKLYRNGTAVTQSSVKAVKADSFKIELTANAAGTISGYIQRSAPAANGACPAAPTTALTRIAKYTVTVSQVTTLNCGATNAINSVITFAGYIPPNVDCILYRDGIFLNAGFLDGTASVAKFKKPNGIAFDGTGNLYIADTENNAVRKVSTDGVVSTVAGTGVSGSSNGNASVATFNRPTSVALDDAGNVYVADSGNNLIRKISIMAGNSTATPGRIVSTVAGSGVAGFANGPGALASFDNPVALVYFDKTLYVADRNNNSIRSLNLGTSVVATLAGSGAQGELDGLGTAAKFNLPNSMAVDATGNLYVTTESAAIYQGYAGAVRKVSPSGNVTTLIISRGSGPQYPSGVVADQYFYTLNGISIAPNGDVYVGTMFQIFKINPAGTVASNYAGFYNVNFLPWSMVRNGALKTAMFNLIIGGLAFDSRGNLYVADTESNIIRKIILN
jgi:sugar lactone lactonase YvrE